MRIDPAPHESDVRRTDPPELCFEPLLPHFERPRPSMTLFEPLQLFSLTLIRTRIRLSKMLWIRNRSKPYEEGFRKYFKNLEFLT
jgi:hypothetical protein